MTIKTLNFDLSYGSFPTNEPRTHQCPFLKPDFITEQMVMKSINSVKVSNGAIEALLHEYK